MPEMQCVTVRTLSYSTKEVNRVTWRTLRKKDQTILQAWDRYEELDPDISTERLLALVESETGYDAGDIAEVLCERGGGNRNE